jgi:lysozyme
MNIDPSLIKEFEGCKLKPYQDIIGIATIGWGHKILSNENFSAGITQAQADIMLLNDLAPIQKYLETISNLTDNKASALASFAYNLGMGPLKTMLGHGIDQVPTQIIKWNHAAGVVEEGLTRRREAELALWNK